MAHAGGLDLSPAARIAAAEAVRAAAGPELGPLALEQALLRERARGQAPPRRRAVVDRRGARAGHLVRGGGAPGAALRPARCSTCAARSAATCWRCRTARPASTWTRRGCCSPPRTPGCSAGGCQLVRADVHDARRRAATCSPTRPGAAAAGGCSTPAATRRRWTLVLGWLPAAALARGEGGARRRPRPPCRTASSSSWCRCAARSRRPCCGRGGPRGAAPRSATLLPAGVTLLDDPVAAPAVRPPGRWLLEPDGAVVRAHLVEQVVAAVGGWLLDATIAYVSADEPVADAVRHLVRGARGAAVRPQAAARGAARATTPGRWW